MHCRKLNFSSSRISDLIIFTQWSRWRVILFNKNGIRNSHIHIQRLEQRDTSFEIHSPVAPMHGRILVLFLSSSRF